MNFFSLVLKRWLIFSLLVIALPIVAGTVAYQTLPKEGEPEISAPVAIVVTLFPGASPSEVESLVTTPIEEELSDLKDVEEMRSNSAEGVSVVVVDFQAEADLETIAAEGARESQRCPQGTSRPGRGPGGQRGQFFGYSPS